MTEGSSKWRRTLLPASASLRDAIRNLDESGMQIVLIVDANARLVGTLTDGDIRRGLLRGMTLDDGVDRIVARDPLVAPPTLARETALQLMQANRIHQLPIVDEERAVVGLHLLDDLMLPDTRPNLMVIMAGGQGSRLRPHTEHCPKPMLPVGGKPMMERIIERAKGDGIRRFAVAIHYLGHMVEEYFGTGRNWQIDIDYLREETPLGTAGAVGLLDPRPENPFLVCNGDVLTEIRYGELLDFHVAHGAVATMAVRPHEWQNPFGVVRTKGVDIEGFEEKPTVRSHINAGIYVLSPAALDALVPGQRCDMPTLFNALKQRGQRTIAYPMHEPWLDVGRPDDYQQVHDGAALPPLKR
ncbi:MAG TPA: nucleotidyltransferase family protein [Steroidobacteraceae bacterium]|nr:nucleotidyltransferase family protein [Steroidobacteraceae bacterium]